MEKKYKYALMTLGNLTDQVFSLSATIEELNEKIAELETRLKELATTQEDVD